MKQSIAVFLVATIVSGILPQQPAHSQSQPRYRSAIVVLTEDAELRASLEDSLKEKGLANGYDAVASYTIANEIEDVDSRRFRSRLANEDIQLVLMLRPAAIGPNASLDSVRNSVAPEVYERMRMFARDLSDTNTDDMLAVVHMAIYLLVDGDTELVSAGAVWLDEAVDSREDGIDRLEDLVVGNINAARPTLRRILGSAGSAPD